MQIKSSMTMLCGVDAHWYLSWWDDEKEKKNMAQNLTFPSLPLTLLLLWNV